MRSPAPVLHKPRSIPPCAAFVLTVPTPLTPPHPASFVVERTIEENVHALSQQRAAAMDLSAASGAARLGGLGRGWVAGWAGWALGTAAVWDARDMAMALPSSPPTHLNPPA